MATTFTSNYQIKLIGTGLESGTWGTSTNENLKRIEQVLGGNKLAFDVQAPGGNSTYTAGTPDELLWITTDTSDSGAVGSEGRCLFVQFTNAAGATTVRVRGSTSTEYPNRVFFVWNASGETLTFNCNATLGTNTYAVEDGAYAVLATTSSDFYVRNLLSALQIDSLTFPAAADISILDDNAASLDITEGSNSYLKFNTTDSSEAVVVGKTLDIDTATIDVATQATTLSLKENADAAFDIKEDDQSYIECDTQTSGPQVLIGGGAEVVTLNIDTATIDVATQVTDIDIKDDEAEALQIDGSTNMMTFDTQDGAEKVIVPVELEVTGTLDVDGTSNFSAKATFSAGVDIDGAGAMDNTVIGANTAAAGTFALLTSTGALVSGAGGYINFNTTTGSGGIGIRNDSGNIEASTDGSSWESFIFAVKLALDTAASDSTDDDKQGCFDIGPIRVIYNTVDVNNGYDIYLGNAPSGDSGKGFGTTQTMATQIYTVMGVAATSTSSQSMGVRVENDGVGGGNQIIRISSGYGVTAHLFTYWAIGDSGK